MKAKRMILIVLGWLCIFLNLAGWLGVVVNPNSRYAPHGIPEIVGFNFWFFIGFVFLLRANKLKRKIKAKVDQEEFDSFLMEKTISDKTTQNGRRV